MKMKCKIVDIQHLPNTREYTKFSDNPPDCCLMAGDSHCGIWWKRGQPGAEKYGLIGHYYAKDRESSDTLLKESCRILGQNGCRKVYGPMDGSTWNSYRLVTWSDGSPPFLMEPQNQHEWVDYWLESGFVAAHEYLSTSVSHLNRSDPRLEKARRRLQKSIFTGNHLSSAALKRNWKRCMPSLLQLSRIIFSTQP
jgi:hypothetical protein